MEAGRAGFQPLSHRAEWADIRPLAPPPTPQPVVQIGRDEQLGDAMDYFWAAVAQEELSERVLALTGEIIVDLNSSNYTVWEWRWRCINALGGVEGRAVEEWALTRSVATSNPKNYQLWNYRRRLALALGPEQAAEELAFAAACLEHDAKNYHAWAHRQAILAALATPALWSAELAYTDLLLRRDVRNNSAWNQRVFVLLNAPPGAVGEPGEAYNSEVEYVIGQLRQAPHNESAWEALRSLATLSGAPAAAAAAGGPAALPAGGLRPPPFALASDPRYLEVCRELLYASPACSPALSLLSDVLLEQAALLEAAAASAALATEQADGSSSSSGGAATSREAAAAGARMARRLAREVLDRQAAADPVKWPYLQLEMAALGVQLGQAG